MLDVAIVGFGARGISVLERFVSKSLSGALNENINIFIFDPVSLGWGCHSPNQDKLLLVNTVASQMTIFYDSSLDDDNFFIKGPDFYEFLKIRGYNADKYSYYSRSLLGEYLEFCFHIIKNLSTRKVNINIIKEKVSNLSKQGNKFISQSENALIEVDVVFITTGHPFDSKEDFIFPCYPLENSIKGITDKNKIAIKGLGLSFIDLITLLTSGKGGHFERKLGSLVYIPSGAEPIIYAFSRSNVPLMTRAVTQKEVREQYVANFLSIKNIAKLKKQKKELDFINDIIPLILKEMEYVYSYTYLSEIDLEKSFVFRNEYLLSSSTADVVGKYIEKKIGSTSIN